jgi:HD-like signal output (HDOD) protein
MPLDTASSITPRVMATLTRLRELPASAPIVHKALGLLENPDFVVAELKRTLLSDPAIAARILRLANSAYFGFRSEVQTVSQAIILLGQHRIRTLLQRILVDKLLSDLAHGRTAAAPLRNMALATATASCTLSQLLMHEDAEEMMLAGLLHNIGDLFLLSQFPAEYALAVHTPADSSASQPPKPASTARQSICEW